MARRSSQGPTPGFTIDCVRIALPFDPNDPTNYEMNCFTQMVTHAVQCKFKKCYLIGGPLSCRSIRAAVKHCHHLDTLQQCPCPMCRSFTALYNHHEANCRLPVGQCPFVVCSVLKRRRHRREAARPRAPPNSTATGNNRIGDSPQGENVSDNVVQQPSDVLADEVQQNSSASVVATDQRTTQGSASADASTPSRGIRRQRSPEPENVAEKRR